MRFPGLPALPARPLLLLLAATLLAGCSDGDAAGDDDAGDGGDSQGPACFVANERDAESGLKAHAARCNAVERAEPGGQSLRLFDCGGQGQLMVTSDLEAGRVTVVAKDEGGSTVATRTLHPDSQDAVVPLRDSAEYRATVVPDPEAAGSYAVVLSCRESA